MIMFSRIARVLAALVVTFSAVLVPSAAQAVTPCPPSGGGFVGMCLGLWTNGNQSGDYSTENSFPATVNNAIIYAGWLTWPATAANAAHAAGYEPFVKFDPNVPITQVVSGNGYGSTLNAFADALSAFGHPAYLQYAGEFNGTWPANYGYTHYTPAQYDTSYKYVVSTINARLSADGSAGLAKWVFTPNICNTGSGNCSPSWPDWWPGNSYVDILGIDGYANASTDTFSGAFTQTVNQRANAGDAASLPMIVGETGIKSGFNTSTKTTAWVHGACTLGFRDFYYFDAFSNSAGIDYTLTSGEASAMATALGNGSCVP